LNRPAFTPSAADWKRIKDEAVARSKRGRKTLVNRRVSKGSDVEIDTVGVLCEWGLASYLHLDTTPIFAPCPDSGTDFLYAAKTLQVKGTTHASGRLIWGGAIKDLSTDLVVLCLAHDMPTVRIAGWMWCDEAEAMAQWKRLASDMPECWVLEQKHLNDPGLLLTLATPNMFD